MTPAALTAWRNRLGLSQSEAARVLSSQSLRLQGCLLTDGCGEGGVKKIRIPRTFPLRRVRDLRIKVSTKRAEAHTTEMIMQIEAGKTYVTRDGRQVRIDRETNNESRYDRFVGEYCDNGTVTWRGSKGRFTRYPHRNDLVAEG